jgi:hypothetical protein
MCPFAHIYADATDAPQPEGYEEDEKDKVSSVFFFISMEHRWNEIGR